VLSVVNFLSLWLLTMVNQTAGDKDEHKGGSYD
jgi:hypothetical protein